MCFFVSLYSAPFSLFFTSARFFSILVLARSRPQAHCFMSRAPLHRSLELAKDVRITNLLLQRGADLSTVTTDQKTPLHTYFNPVVETALLSYTAQSSSCLDYEARDGRGRTLLHYLAWSSKTTLKTFERVHAQSLAAIEVLDVEGRSVLHFAAQRGNAVLISYILSTTNHVLDVNGRDCRGKTPMHYAVETRRARETIEVLALCEGEVKAREADGRTPLHLAAERDRAEAVMLLLEIDAACGEETDRFGMTALQVAEEAGAEAVKAYLVNEFIVSKRRERVWQLREEARGGVRCHECRCYCYCCPYRETGQQIRLCDWRYLHGTFRDSCLYLCQLIWRFLRIKVQRVWAKLTFILFAVMVLLGVNYFL